MSKAIYKCGFKLCQHESRDIPRDEAVKVNTRYLHNDCAIQSKYLQQTKDLYFQKVSDTVVMSNLMSVLKNIIITKKINPCYVYFALDFAVTNNIPIRSPFGLYYLIDNSRIKAAWNMRQAQKIARQIEEESVSEISTSNPVGINNSFKFSKDKPIGFTDIFKEGLRGTQ